MWSFRINLPKIFHDRYVFVWGTWRSINQEIIQILPVNISEELFDHSCQKKMVESIERRTLFLWQLNFCLMYRINHTCLFWASPNNRIIFICKQKSNWHHSQSLSRTGVNRDPSDKRKLEIFVRYLIMRKVMCLPLRTLMNNAIFQAKHSRYTRST